MGTLNDVYFTPMNGNAATEEEGDRLNEEFGRRKEHVYVLADGLRRARDRSGAS